MRQPGVINTIVHLLLHGGGTADQLAAKLARRFPKRKRDGLRRTLMIQLSRLPKERKLKIRKRKAKGKPTGYWAGTRKPKVAAPET